MSAELIAAGITGGSQVGSGFFGLLGAKRQRKFQREMADYAYTKDLEMWNRQNEYNKPLAQKQRMEEAGLNPALMYKGAPQNVSTQMPKHQRWDTPTYSHQFNPLEILGQYQDYKIKKGTEEAVKQDVVTKNIKNKYLADTMLSNLEKTQIGNLEGLLRTGATKRDGQYWVKDSESPYLKRYSAETEKVLKDNLIRDFEIQLNKSGLTKSDQKPWRMLAQVMDLDDLREWLNLLGKDVKKAKGY